MEITTERRYELLSLSLREAPLPKKQSLRGIPKGKGARPHPNFTFCLICGNKVFISQRTIHMECKKRVI